MKRPAAVTSAMPMKRPAAVHAMPMKRPAAAQAKPDWYDVPDGTARLMNYLVTASKLLHEEDVVADPPLRDPADITKAEFKSALMDSIANPVPIQSRSGGRPRTLAVELDIYFGVKEGPEDAHQTSMFWISAFGALWRGS